jgi:bifunctional DNase/RNase
MFYSGFSIDAIAVAIRAGAPILAEEEVLDLAGTRLDKETGKQPAEPLGWKPMRQEPNG